MAFKENLSAFIDTDGFAITVKIGGIDTNAIYDHGSNSASIGSVGFDAIDPSLTCVTADIPPGTKQETPVIAQGINYKVKTIHPDGTGITTIELKK